MKKIKILLAIFIILSIISYIFMGNILLPLSIIFFFFLSSIVGIPMALDYPWSTEVHQFIIISSSISFLVMIYGGIKRKTRLGIVSFVLGFISWSMVGLVYGLGQM
jgi:hypothetical protein